MILLAIETSVSDASLCLAADENILFSANWQAERNHDAHLFPALQQALAAIPSGTHLDYVLIGAGPGSYGGVRVALAAGVGIATVTGATLVAVESWEQLAELNVCIVADARRNGWTVRRPNGIIEVLSTEELSAIDAPLYTVEAPGFLASKGITGARKEGVTPRAEGLVNTWLRMSDVQRADAVSKPAEPIYVRPPHITKATRKPWEIG